MSNAHYAFHAEYFSDLCGEDGGFARRNRALVNTKYVPVKGEKARIPLSDHSFQLIVRYPGLLMGLGYPHDISKAIGNSADDAVKLGFSIDYTTGLPVIPGSSVKGMLRAAFRLRQENEEAWQCIPALCAPVGILGIECAADVIALEAALFGAWCDDKQAEREAAPGASSRDAFLDALPIATPSDQRLWGIENITPHQRRQADNDGKLPPDPYEGMKNPTPLKLLKVRPGVTFLFRFILKDTQIQREHPIKATADQKCELYKQILSQLGVGAKTNVGFGVMEGTNAQADCVELTPALPASIAAATTRNIAPATQGKCRGCGGPTGKKRDGSDAYHPLCSICAQRKR